jgi:hypothetical protein
MTADQLTDLDRANAVVRTFQTACQTADVDLLLTVLAPEAVFRSPLTMLTVFTGHRDIGDLMAAALNTVKGIDYHTELGDEHTRALFSTARVDGQEIEEVALLRIDHTGDGARITEITLWVRPLPGATALMNGIGPRLLRRLGRTRMASVLPVLSKPLGFLVRFADRQAVGMLERK